MKARLLFALVSVLIVWMLVWPEVIVHAEVSSTVHILPDGSVEPPEAGLRSCDNVTYAFDSNLSCCIVVDKDDIVIDGRGFFLFGAGDGEGFVLLERRNVTIENVSIERYQYGVSILNSFNTQVLACHILDNMFGLKIESSMNSSVISNIIEANGFGIILASSSYNTLQGNSVLSNEHHGLFFYSSSSNIIADNYIIGNFRGIYSDFCSNNMIINNSILNNTYKGVRLAFSSQDTLCQNNISFSSYGLWLFNSSDNHILQNKMNFNAFDGLLLEYSNSNLVVGNELKLNGRSAVYLDASEGNSIFHNNFVNNTVQIYCVSIGTANIWNSDLEGNYWSDYVGLDIDSDGIDDFSKTIDAGNVDSHPLMGAFSAFSFSTNLGLYAISNSTIERCQYISSDGVIRMHISEIIGEMGFCRLCVPLTLLNVTAVEVLVDGGSVSVLLFKSCVFDNSTHRWIYFAYDESTSEIVIAPEYSFTRACLVFGVATVLCLLFKFVKRCLRVKTGFSEWQGS